MKTKINQNCDYTPLNIRIPTYDQHYLYIVLNVVRNISRVLLVNAVPNY